jgi:hypothetical protein
VTEPSRRSQPRVLLAPRNISGQATEYARAVGPRGIEAQVWSFGLPAYGFEVDRVIDRERLLSDPSLRWAVLDEAVRGFDTFHLQYGRSLLDPVAPGLPDLWDLPLLKSLGKRVFMHFRGSDVRLRSLHVQREPHSYFNEEDVPCDEDRIRARIEICRRFCDRIFVSTPGLLDYVPDGRWIPHVIDTDRWAFRPREERTVPVIAHIPSNSALKGSRYVDAAAGSLESRGRCRYRRLQGLTREELRTALEDVDVLVDSLTIGDHGLISVEAMAVGTIAVAHIHERNRERNPGVPIVEATVEDVGEVLDALCADTGRRRMLREVSRSWVEQRHSHDTVGEMLARAYRSPVREVAQGRPDWPSAAQRPRQDLLEAEIERLATGRDRIHGVVHLLTDPPSQVAVTRLLRRIDELEATVGGQRPRSSLVRRVRSETARTLRRSPRLHLLARRIVTRLQR